MPKSVCVFAHDADPAKDNFCYRISRDEAAVRLVRGYVRPIGPRAVQLKAPPDYVPDTKNSGIFGEVWQPRFSAHYLVMQMCPTLSEPE